MCRKLNDGCSETPESFFFFALYLTPGLLEGQDNGSRWSLQTNGLILGLFHCVHFDQWRASDLTRDLSTIDLISIALLALIRQLKDLGEWFLWRKRV